MLNARWHKVLADLGGNKARTALVVLSIAVGVLAIGMVVGSRGIIERGLAESHAAGRFASSTLTTQLFDQPLIEEVRRVPGVAQVEGRRLVGARLSQRAGEWRDLWLFAVPDYHRIGLSRIKPEAGAWPPPEREILLERASLAFLKATISDTVRVEMPDGTQRQVRIAGTAHDLNPPSSGTSGILYGYVTFETLEWLGEARGMNQLHIAVAERNDDKEHIRRVAAAVREKVEESGRTVFMTTVPDPGKFWVNDHVQSMMLLLTLLGAVCLCMSGFLVTNIISALLAQQIRQIGVMKSVGASAAEVTVMYLGTIFFFGLLALAVGIPLGAVAAVGLVLYSTNLLNFDVAGFSLAPDVLALEVAAGLVVPLLAALVPVITGSRITIREAITSYGLGQGEGYGRFMRLVERIPGVSLATRLSLRNTFRRKSRLLLTLAALTLGGAIFVGVLSVRDSIVSTLEDAVRYRNYDVELTFSRPYPVADLEREASRINSVAKAEAWAVGAAHRLRTDGNQSDTMTIIGAPVSTELIRPILLQGRWLQPGDGRDVVVNTDVLKLEPDIGVGDALRLKVNGKEETWNVVGLVRGVLSGPVIY
ncbi:MAG TPA: ABC transporter permease, partial [Chloroflexota bacterium]|nr:ABC transporter permease [Chloroflexota bacterium]